MVHLGLVVIPEVPGHVLIDKAPGEACAVLKSEGSKPERADKLKPKAETC